MPQNKPQDEGASADAETGSREPGLASRSGPSGFDPARSEWVTPEFREAEKAILLAMYEGVDPDFGFFPFKSIVRRSGVALELVKPLVRLLALTGEATFLRGLMSEEGEMVGSGYGLTEKGRDRARASAIEAAAAGETHSGSTEGESAVGAAETPNTQAKGPLNG